MGLIPVLLLDADAEVRGMVADNLQAAGFRPTQAATIAEAEALVLRGTVWFEALLLDVSLPDGDGCDLCARLRAARQHMPVLMLAGSDAKRDVVRGLAAGAHDFLAKPVRLPVLIARLRAQLRHHEHSMDAVLTVGRWRFHPVQKLLRDEAGGRIGLTLKEVGILRCLLRMDGAVAAQQLLADVWGCRADASTRTLQTHIHRLRRKIEADPRNARLLVTTKDGYRLAAHDAGLRKAKVRAVQLSQTERSSTMREPESMTAALQPGLRVLVIEDDQAVARAFIRGVERAGMQAAWASTGALGVALKDSFRPHVVLVDLHLPDMSGLTLISRFAEQRDCGVIVVSGSGEEDDRVVGLELGADDYITKPMSMSEMVARIRAVHRRVSQAKLPKQQEIATSETQVVEVGSIRIDVGRRMAQTLDGRRLALTSAEFTALEVLARAAGAPVSRDVLSEIALRRPWRAEDRSVDQLVFNLRQKLPPDEDGGALIQSIRGAGYRLRPPERVAPSQAQAALAG